MTTAQALDRIRTICGLSGLGYVDCEAILRAMIRRGTWSVDHTRVDLAALWVAVDDVEKDEKSRG